MTDTAFDTDRRNKPHLREIFVEAYEVLLVFFDPANNWAGQSHHTYLAYRALREHFPGLSSEEASVMVDAAWRVFSTTGKPAVP